MAMEVALVSPCPEAAETKLDCRALRTPTVTIRVGPSEQSFYINHEILCRYSLFSRQLTREQNVISLPEVDEMSFAVFAEWLYLGEDCDTAEIMEDALREQEKGEAENEELEDERTIYDHYDFSLQFSCYLLADKFQAPAFKIFITDEIRFHGDVCRYEKLTLENVRYVYKNTFHRNDPLWRFCVQMKRHLMDLDNTSESKQYLTE